MSNYQEALDEIGTFTAEEYADVFRRVGIMEKERELLLFIAAQEKQTSTTTLIADGLGWADRSEVNFVSGQLGKRVCAEFRVNPKYKYLALVSYIEENGQHLRLVMRPAVAQALRLL